MEIAGLQKTTLVDYPGKVACTIFLHSCNFRCGFCYNPDLVTKEFTKGFSEEEILGFLKKRKGKLEAVCITGGEPLISLDEEFLKKIKDLGYLIKLDTNGSFPEKLKKLIDDNLVDFIAMDIKGSKENYDKIISVKAPLEKIEQSIKIIHDFGKYEFRTTAVDKFHEEEEIEKLGKWLMNICIEKPKKYYLQGFKNNGDFIDSSFKKEKNTTEKKLKELKKVAEKYFENVEIRV